jgi:hypothetical protein
VIFGGPVDGRLQWISKQRLIYPEFEVEVPENTTLTDPKIEKLFKLVT